MRQLPGLHRLVQVDMSRSAELLAPWLGADLASDLPLPRLFDLHFAAPPKIDFEQFNARLGELSSVVEAHTQWMGHVATLTRAVEALGLAGNA